MSRPSFPSSIHLNGRHLPVLCFIAWILMAIPSHAQSSQSDSLTIASRKRANRAALYSTILPGAGQVYNHKYWKVPILAAGAGTLIYLIGENNRYYDEFRTAYIERADGDPDTQDDYPNLTLEDLRVRKDYYRRNRDLCYILGAGLYILNIVDAYVDAQLKGFDVSDDLSMKLSPTLLGCQQDGMTAGLRITFNLRHADRTSRIW